MHMNAGQIQNGGRGRQTGKFMIETFYHLFKSNHTLANSITNATSHSILLFTRRNNAPTKCRSSKILLLPSGVLLSTSSQAIIKFTLALPVLECRSNTCCALTTPGVPKLVPLTPTHLTSQNMVILALLLY